MHLGVAHHAFLPDVAAPRLELRLDQRHDLSRVFQQMLRRLQHLLQGYERHVDRGEVQQFPNILGADVADIRPLHIHHPRVVPELPRELPVSDVDGIDLRRAVLERAVREAARGRADVGHDPARKGNPEDLQRLFELQPAPAHIGKRVAQNTELRILLHHRPGLVNLLPVHQDEARHQRRLRLLAALDEPALYQQYVQPFFCHLTRAPPISP